MTAALLPLLALLAHYEGNDHVEWCSRFVVDSCIAYPTLPLGHCLHRLDDLLETIKRPVNQPVVHVDVHYVGFLRLYRYGLVNVVVSRKLFVESAARFLFWLLCRCG